MNNIDTFSSYSEENEIFKNIKRSESNSNDSGSYFSSQNDEKNNGELFINETYNEGNNNNNYYNFGGKKQRNIIDYLNINDNAYKKQQLYKKINIILNKFKPLPQNIIDEINYLSWYYTKKLPNKNLLTIVSIIIYKIIKKYNIKTITLKDLKAKLNFSYSTYFKNEKLFNELNTSINQKDSKINIKYNNNINNIIYSKKQPFSELILNSITNNIKLIKEKNETFTNIIKLKNKKHNRNKKINDSKNAKNVKHEYKIIEVLFTKISQNENNINELYGNPVNIELNNCLKQCKLFIYNNNNQNKSDINSDELMSETNVTNHTINLKEDNKKFLYDENMFNNFFENKVEKDILSLSLIKYFIDNSENISMSYNKMKDIFNCNIYKIKKCIIHIKEYINYINKNE